MDVSETLKTAWAAVERADLPEKIQETAFREAVRLFAPVEAVTSPPARLVREETPKAGAEDVTAQNAGGAVSVVAESEIYERVAAHTGVDRDLLEQLIHLDGDAIKISVAGLRLGKNNAERARAVVQILTIARGFGFEETDTPLEVIRAECDRLKVYDQANFSGQVKALSGYVVTGSGNHRRVRARGAGIQGFPALVTSIVGGES